MLTPLSRFSIRQQILIGYIPVLAILAFLAFSSYQNFRHFDKSFQSLQEITTENLTFLEIERGMVELQRNILVYSYVGYRGVLRKIEFLQKQLEVKFKIIQPFTERDEEIKDRFDRMLGHYNDYKEGFDEAIDERDQIDALITEKLTPTNVEITGIIDRLETAFIDAKNFEAAYILNEIEHDFYIAKSNVKSFKQFPDSAIIKETRSLISLMQEDSDALKTKISDETTLAAINRLQALLEDYQTAFMEIIRLNRTYLYLINVVLAGKAAEIDTLADELDSLVKKRSNALTVKIQENMGRAKNQFIILSVSGALIGFLSSLFIAMGIANPVTAMASTLSRLANGESNIQIPGQQRKDEVGEMAKAANEFKIMANELESQSSELEEFAYRTSHDLRSPLVSSIALLDLAEDSIKKDEKDQAQQSIGLIKSSLQKLETLVRDILELTKTKNIKEDFKEINLKDIIESSLTKFAHMDDFNRIDFKVELNHSSPLKTLKSRVVLILENLISNAVKYQDTSKEKSFINIATEETEKFVIINVEDNGLGIPEDQQSELFSMFKRFHPTVSFGSGLGLYMMKKSADIIGGDISFQDTKDGSKFILKIPKS